MSSTINYNPGYSSDDIKHGNDESDDLDDAEIDPDQVLNMKQDVAMKSKAIEEGLGNGNITIAYMPQLALSINEWRIRGQLKPEPEPSQPYKVLSNIHRLWVIF